MLRTIELENTPYEREFIVSEQKLTISGLNYLGEVQLPYEIEAACIASNMMGDRVVLGYPTKQAVLYLSFNKSSCAWNSSSIKRDVDGYGTAVSLKKDRLVIGSLDSSTYVYEYQDSEWIHTYTIQQSSYHVAMTPDSSMILLGFDSVIMCYSKDIDNRWSKRQIIVTDHITGLLTIGNKLIAMHKNTNTAYVLESMKDDGSNNIWTPI